MTNGLLEGDIGTNGLLEGDIGWTMENYILPFSNETL